MPRIIYRENASRTKNMIYLSLPLWILTFAPEVYVVWAKGNRLKSFIRNTKVPEVFTANLFFILQQCLQVLPIDKLSYYPFIMTFAVFETGNRWHPSISVAFTSISESLQMLIVLSSRPSLVMLFGIPVSSTLFS